MVDPIVITKVAADAMQKKIAAAPDGVIGLRLDIRQKGCSGNSYVLAYVHDHEDTSGDDIFAASLYVSKTLSWMLFGMTIDYGVDEVGNEGFQFLNPNEKGRCGCGESFQV